MKTFRAFEWRDVLPDGAFVKHSSQSASARDEGRPGKGEAGEGGRVEPERVGH